MDSCPIDESLSHLQPDDFRGNVPVEQFYRNPDVHRLRSVIDTSCVMGLIRPRGPCESIHPPVVLCGNLPLRWKPQLPSAPTLTEKMY